MKCRNQDGIEQLLEAATVLHLGYLVEAQSAYNNINVSHIDLENEGPEAVAEYILKIIKELDGKDEEKQVRT